jgi:hypothetical protein
LTGRAYGLHPVLHHNYVQTPDDADERLAGARLWVPAAGPLVSLLQGVLCLAWLRTRKRRSAFSLTILWLGLHGLIGFFGYLMMGPLFRYGDTGKVYAELGVPGAVPWLLAVAGLVALVVVARSTAAEFARHVMPAPPGVERPRGRVGNALIAWPILAGAVVTSLLSLPVPSFLSLLHPMTSPFVVFTAYGRLRREKEPLPEGASYPEGVPVASLVALAIVVGLFRWLVPGLRL